MNSESQQNVEPTSEADISADDIKTPVHVALLVDKDFLSRFHSLSDHMLVGLLGKPVTVTLLCPDPDVTKSIPVGPARVIEFKVPLLPWNYKQAMKDLAAELKAAKVNVIHSCSGKPCWLARDVARAANLPYLVSFTGLFQEECYTHLDQQQCAGLIGISKPICDTLHDLYGKTNKKIELIRPGCFVKPRKPKNDQPKTIMSIGNFTRNSGYDVLLRALAEVKDRGLDCLTILFGQGPLENELHRWASKHGLSGVVSFIDMIPNWEDVLGDVDFYIQPGPFYTLHSGPYEAMANGCPIIAPDDTAFDLLTDGETGRTFKTGDYKSLANILTEWLENKDGKFDWQSLSDQALARAKSELSLFESTEKLANCYREIVARENEKKS